MNDVLIMIASNLFVASIIAIIALLLERTGRHRTIVHALWIVVLVKLITPPIIELPLIPIERSVDAKSTDDELHSHIDEHPVVSPADLYQSERVSPRELDDGSLDQEHVVENDDNKSPVPPPIQRIDSSTRRLAPLQQARPASTLILPKANSARAILYVILCMWIAGGSI